jgi:hypothetical protein
MMIRLVCLLISTLLIAIDATSVIFAVPVGRRSLQFIVFAYTQRINFRAFSQIFKETPPKASGLEAPTCSQCAYRSL